MWVRAWSSTHPAEIRLDRQLRRLAQRNGHDSHNGGRDPFASKLRSGFQIEWSSGWSARASRDDHCRPTSDSRIQRPSRGLDASCLLLWRCHAVLRVHVRNEAPFRLLESFGHRRDFHLCRLSILWCLRVLVSGPVYYQSSTTGMLMLIQGRMQSY
jgi:hypothetical protein